jgi:ribonuclease R
MSSDAIQRILKQFKVSIAHPENCIDEAQQLLANPGLSDPSLEQWQSAPFVTIDNPDSRDLDQAILIERAADAGYRVRYALADASFYVKPGMALFDEALKRGVTYYTPLLAAPMLPIELSEGLVSLNPNVDRRALVFDMYLRPDGTVINTTIVRACINSQAKLSYASVQQSLDDNLPDAAVYNDSLALLKELGEILINNALDRDVIPFHRSETSIELVNNELRMSQRRRVRTEKYNEQISLLCNMQGAQLLDKLAAPELQSIFRVHDAPLPGRVSNLRKLINAFAELKSINYRWEKGQSLADYVQALPSGPDALALQRQILICNQASEYRPEPGRHHALAVPSYARFSSPMREIVGIFTHKELLEALGDEPPMQDQQLRDQIIEIANQSRQTQKQINKAIEFEALQHLLKKQYLTHRGIIMGFKGDKIYVACDEIACDLKVKQQDLQQQYNSEYALTDLRAVPTDNNAPTFTLGDEVSVQSNGYNEQTRRFSLLLMPLA